ncbi:MAG TPA: SURF1 family protein [Actinomycetota bacterium]
MHRLVRGRWLVGHLIVLSLAALFIRLGFWQLHRLAEVKAQNALIEARRADPPVDLGAIVRPSEPTGDRAVERRVSISGRFDAAHQAFEFTPLNGEPGVDLFTPLVRSDGSAVIVDRGWIPQEPPQEHVPAEAEPPSGQVRVTGIALAGDTGGAAVTAGGLIQLTRIDLVLIQARVPYDLFPVFVRLQTQTPGQPGKLPIPMPPPALDEGPHFSYAIQWFTFAAIGLIGWPILLHHVARER